MSASTNSAPAGSKVFIGSLVALFGFGLLVALVVAGGAGESPLDRTAKGEFSEETTQLRWKNKEEVSAAQKAALSPDKLDQAVAAVIKENGKSKAKKTELVVPGSPTFLKQAAAAAPAPAPDGASATGVDSPAPAPAPAAGEEEKKPAIAGKGGAKAKGEKPKGKSKAGKNKAGKKKGQKATPPPAAQEDQAPANPNPQQ